MVKKKIQRGFAVIDLERRKEIASLGGKAAHARGTAHRWTPETSAYANLCREKGKANG